MTRYQALRHIGCGPFSSSVIAFCNWVRGYPPGVIRFLTAEIEYPASLSGKEESNGG